MKVKHLTLSMIKGNHSGKQNIIAAMRLLGFKKYGTFVELITISTLKFWLE